MSPEGRARAGRGIGTGLKAGGIVGFLTGLRWVVVVRGVDFSRTNPFRALLAVAPRDLVVLGILILAGAGLGALVSWRTPDE